MAEKPKSRLMVTKFGGLNSGDDSHDLKPGEMQSQVNLQMFTSGRLQCRRGMRLTAFENAITSTSNHVLSIAMLIKPEANLFVYEDSGGNVRVGRKPT